MLSHFANMDSPPKNVRLLYGSKYGKRSDLRDVLFVQRLMRLAFWSQGRHAENCLRHLELFMTGQAPSGSLELQLPLHIQGRRMKVEDVRDVLLFESSTPAAEEALPLRALALFYVCGPQAMSDSFVEGIKRIPGVKEERVLCEKWW